MSEVDSPDPRNRCNLAEASPELCKQSSVDERRQVIPGEHVRLRENPNQSAQGGCDTRGTLSEEYRLWLFAHDLPIPYSYEEDPDPVDLLTDPMVMTDVAAAAAATEKPPTFSDHSTANRDSDWTATLNPPGQLTIPSVMNGSITPGRTPKLYMSASTSYRSPLDEREYQPGARQLPLTSDPYRLSQPTLSRDFGPPPTASCSHSLPKAVAMINAHNQSPFDSTLSLAGEGGSWTSATPAASSSSVARSQPTMPSVSSSTKLPIAKRRTPKGEQLSGPRKTTNVSCVCCVKAKTKCGVERPCLRCCRLNQIDQCIDRPATSMLRGKRYDGEFEDYEKRSPMHEPRPAVHDDQEPCRSLLKAQRKRARSSPSITDQSAVTDETFSFKDEQ